MLFVCVCAGFGFHFVYAVVCLCACSDMVMHVGLSHFGCHVFFLPHMYPYPNYSFTTPGSSCFFSNLCMYMVFAMNEPLQAGSLCRLSQSLEKAVLEIHHVGLIQAWFLCFTEARLKHLGLVFPLRKVHIHHTPWFFF